MRRGAGRVAGGEAVLVSTDRATLSAALHAARRFSARADLHQRLTDLHTEDGRLVLSGSAPELRYRLHITAATHHPGRCTLDPDTLSTAIDATPDGSIDLHHEHATLRIQHPQHAALLTLDPDHPPSAISFPALVHDSIPSSNLRRAIDSVRPAVSTERHRGVICAVLLEAREQHTRLVATDGIRLARYDAPALPSLTRDRLIHPHHLDAIRHLSDPHDTLLIGYAHPHLHIVSPNGELLIHTLDGNYPDYASAIPAPSSAPITVDARQLRAAIARVAILNHNDPSRRVQLRYEPPHLHLHTSSTYGSAHESLTAHSPQPQPHTLELNSHYLREALAPVRHTAELHPPTAPNRPLRIHDHHDPRYLALLVPLATESESTP